MHILLAWLLPAVLPNGNAPDGTGRHEGAETPPSSWTTQHQDRTRCTGRHERCETHNPLFGRRESALRHGCAYGYCRSPDARIFGVNITPDGQGQVFANDFLLNDVSVSVPPPTGSWPMSQSEPTASWTRATPVDPPTSGWNGARPSVLLSPSWMPFGSSPRSWTSSGRLRPQGWRDCVRDFATGHEPAAQSQMSVPGVGHQQNPHGPRVPHTSHGPRVTAAVVTCMDARLLLEELRRDRQRRSRDATGTRRCRPRASGRRLRTGPGRTTSPEPLP